MEKIPTIGVISLGCAKNLVDTQRLISLLVAKGYKIEADYAQCDLVIINTCGFIQSAIDESLQTIGEALNYTKRVIVMGCLGAKEQLILKEHPQVLKVFGPGLRASVVREVVKTIGQPPQSAIQRLSPSGIILTPSHYAYVKIAEGCRHKCTFCIIPSLRGPLRSREQDAIFTEAQDLVAKGVNELLIIAQDSSDYGIDLTPKSSLYSLCSRLSELNRWIRLHYVYPSAQVDKVIELMAEGKVLPYLDMPLQHANEDILRKMRRPGNIEKTLQRIENWRKICPDLAIRSTFIAGFPSETNEQFQELLDFLQEAKLDRVGCFAYSPVDGAVANDIFPHIDPLVAQERVQRLMELQAKISYQKLKQRVNKSYDVLIDHVTDEGVAIGRSKYESPDVDGQIIIENAKGLKAGQFTRVKITSHDEHDLFGQLDHDFLNNISFCVIDK